MNWQAPVHSVSFPTYLSQRLVLVVKFIQLSDILENADI